VCCWLQVHLTCILCAELGYSNVRRIASRLDQHRHAADRLTNHPLRDHRSAAHLERTGALLSFVWDTTRRRASMANRQERKDQERWPLAHGADSFSAHTRGEGAVARRVDHHRLRRCRSCLHQIGHAPPALGAHVGTGVPCSSMIRALPRFPDFFSMTSKFFCCS